MQVQNFIWSLHDGKILLSKCTEYIDLLKFNNMVLIAYRMFGKSIQRHRVGHVG